MAGTISLCRCGGEDFPFGAVSHSVPLSTLKVSQDLLVLTLPVD